MADDSKWWNMALSILDPELEKFAERLASAIPADSPLRATIVVRIIGVLKAWIESKASSMPGFAGAAIEKLTDAADFFAANLTGSKKEKTKATRDWMDKFFIDAGDRLKEAKTPEAAKTEAEKIKAEFNLRLELLKVIDEARKAAEPAKEEKEETEQVDWQEMYAKLKALLGTLADDAVGAAKWADEKLTPVADWLEQRQGART